MKYKLLKKKRKLVYKVEERIFKLHKTIEQLQNEISKYKQTVKELQSTITELKQSQKNKSLQRSEQLYIIGKVAAGLAHEIKNPLTTIKGLAQLLREKHSNNKTSMEYIDVILKELDQANNVLSDFLQLAYPRKPVFKKQSIHELIKNSIAIIEPQASLKNIQVRYENNKSLPDCMFDQDQIKKVILNMFKNSIEAISEGGVIKIKTDYLPNKKEIYIYIQDNGCGIPFDKLKNIRVPFYTTKADSKGFGLSISDSIIEAHKGRIEVNSKEGEGTIFQLNLPLSQ